MKLKNLISIGLVSSGGGLAIYGLFLSNTSFINLGIAGMLLGAVTFTFKSGEYVKKDIIEILLEPYKSVFSLFSDNLSLNGNAIYIPPFENLPNGGVFIPLYENFELDLARLDEKTVFLTEVPTERAIGLFLGPFGISLVNKYEEHLEGSLNSVGTSGVESTTRSVLKALGLAERIYIEEENENLKVIIEPNIKCDPKNCEKTPCPICASILLALAKATGELILTEKIERIEYGIEITAKKLGGVEKWI